MKIVSEALSGIASALDCDYVRTMSEVEADVYVHNLNSDKVLIVYNGVSDISTSFNGAEIIDTFGIQLFVLVKKTKKEMSGFEIDELLQITKQTTNDIYARLNKETAEDIAEYSAEAVEIFTDKYVGHEVSMEVPFYNEGCTPTP